MEESSYLSNNQKRLLTETERYLVKFLLQKIHREDLYNEMLQVIEIKDGMGSLYFCRSDKLRGQRKMGSQLIVYEMKDFDEIPISISINIDKDNQLFELDVWKVDFSKPIILNRLADLKNLLLQN